jgi:hypothetical protein
MWLLIRIFSFFNGLPLSQKLNGILCIQYAKKMSTQKMSPEIAGETPLFRGAPEGVPLRGIEG